MPPACSRRADSTGYRDRTMRAADEIVSLLERVGVSIVFGIPGVHNLSLFDALEASDVRVVVTRHEGTAAFAADGAARVTGRPGIVLTTTGPGAANALTGTGEAWAASSPVLHLTTQVGSVAVAAAVQRGILHQSPGQIDAFRPVTRLAERVTSAADAARTVGRALAATTDGRPRPAYVEIPFDLLDGEGEPAEAPPTKGRRPRAPDGAEVERAADLLAGAGRVVVWAGGGVIHAGATEVLDRVARRLAAPVVTTYMGRGAVAAEQPLAVGLPPHEPAVRALLEDADALLAVGTDFGATTTMNGALRLPEAIVHLDVEAEEIGKAYPATPVLADARLGLEALEDALAAASVDRMADVEGVGEHLAALRDGVWTEIAADPRTAQAAAFLGAVRAALPPETVFVCDMCVAGYWVGGYLPLPGPRRLLYPLGWGTLGFGLPAAVGAAAAGEGPVVAVVGDAGLMYAVGDLATVREHDLDLVILVVNDEGYGMLRFDEESRFGRTFAADLRTPDLAALSGAFDVPYRLAGIDDGTLESALRSAVTGGGPHVVEVRAALYPPRTTSPRWREMDP